MISLPTNKTTNDGRTIQSLSGNGKPIYACMYLQGSTHITAQNITSKDLPDKSFEGLLVLPDGQGSTITRVAFYVVLEEGCHFDLSGNFIVVDQSQVDAYWDEFIQEITDRGLTYEL